MNTIVSGVETASLRMVSYRSHRDLASRSPFLKTASVLHASHTVTHVSSQKLSVLGALTKNCCFASHSAHTTCRSTRLPVKWQLVFEREWQLVLEHALACEIHGR